MLLCSSSRVPGRRRGVFSLRQVGVDLACDVSLEAADDLAFAQALRGASFDVGASRRVVAHADDGDDVERAVRGSVAAATEPVTPGCAAAAGGLWRDSAEFGEGPFIGDSVR